MPNLSHAAVLRVVDAAANRAAEGLRVVEDFVRFGWDDRHLTELCKHLRHGLAEACRAWPGWPADWTATRSTLGDVGTVVTTEGEYQRTSATDLLAANFSRVQEALRTLEEFAKLSGRAAGVSPLSVQEVVDSQVPISPNPQIPNSLNPQIPSRFESLRYQVYTLHKAVIGTLTSLDRLSDARLYVLIDGRPTLGELQSLAAGLVATGVDVLQLRDKTLDDRALLDRAKALREITRGTPTLLIVNDRPDLAFLADADGVHLGQDDLPPKDARALVGPEMLIGVSTHSVEQARQAVLEGANYIGVGPTFPSTTKQFTSFTGLDLLRAVAADIRLPAFAIGGIQAANIDRVLATGFRRVAVAGAIANAADPGQAAVELRAALVQAPVPQ